MGRPPGASNKPKNAKELLDKVIAEYQKQGKNLTVNIEDLKNLTKTEKAAIAEEVSNNPDITIPEVFSLDDEEDLISDSDSFECGNCHAKLEGESEICEFCGVTLRWQ
ncbi:hypothetical protein CMI37_38920 [Candidatus Pacearchaeota archaeon]|nr:hypothetical protein [Candidatus Pacearchaeota archaeon]|tara:strand:- start:220 stop:543 length:324 start_codon:yes stop_codon:yes gene_type:complete